MTSLPNLQLDLKNQEALRSPHTYQKNALNTILPRHKVNNKYWRETTSLLPPSRPPKLNFKKALRSPRTYEKHVQENSNSPHDVQEISNKRWRQITSRILPSRTSDSTSRIINKQFNGLKKHSKENSCHAAPLHGVI